MPMMASVPRLTNFSPVIAAEIEKPSSIVTMFAISFCAACERRSVTPLTRSTLPNMTKPSSATEAGAMRPPITVIAIGKRKSLVLETGRGA